MRFIEKLKSDERGVAAIEYAVIGAVVLGALAAVFTGTDLPGLFLDLTNGLAGVAPPPLIPSHSRFIRQPRCLAARTQAGG